MKRVLGAFVLVIFVSFATPALAVEGGLGRPISGMSIAPFAGVIPPEPGFLVSVAETYYEGSIGGATTVPIAGLLVANVKGDRKTHDVLDPVHGQFLESIAACSDSV